MSEEIRFDRGRRGCTSSISSASKKVVDKNLIASVCTPLVDRKTGMRN